MKNLHELPPDLPVPKDDGACDHLAGMKIPPIALHSTKGGKVNLADVSRSKAIFFVYPRTGIPDEPTPPSWEAIPGARGCTPQSCGFRDHLSEFQKLEVAVYGVSCQSTKYQLEFSNRNRIPYEILSDEQFRFTDALRLPTFEFNSMRLIKRLALFADKGEIQKVFYPVFPPDKNAEEVLAWLSQSESASGSQV